jgi:hypothetical protein
VSGITQKLGTLMFVLVAGYMTYATSMNHYGVIYVDVGDGRDPAAIRRAYDVSHLDGLALSKKINERLVGDSRILKRDDAIGLELGQFATLSGQNKRLACAIYDRVQMVFQGEGEASNSRPPEMLVEGYCRTSKKDVLFMEPIWIPVTQILASPATSNDLTFYDDEPVSLKFSHINGEWPRRWVLNSIRLYHSEQENQEVIVDREEIRLARPKSIEVQF